MTTDPRLPFLAELGKKILNESGLAVIAADDLADAAEKIVKAVKG